MFRTYTLDITTGDPRLDRCTRVYTAHDVEMCTAMEIAKDWAARGYWASIYLRNGECVKEVKPYEKPTD